MDCGTRKLAMKTCPVQSLTSVSRLLWLGCCCHFLVLFACSLKSPASSRNYRTNLQCHYHHHQTLTAGQSPVSLLTFLSSENSPESMHPLWPAVKITKSSSENLLLCWIHFPTKNQSRSTTNILIILLSISSPALIESLSLSSIGIWLRKSWLDKSHISVFIITILHTCNTQTHS